MADNQNYIGIAMGLDVSDLKTGLSEANKQIQLANSKFKAAASGMDDWTKSTEGLAAKLEQLDTVLKMQKAKLAGLEAEYAKVAKEQGESSDAARRLQVQINNQQAVVNKTEREYKNYQETLKGVKDGSIDLEKVSLKAGKAVEKAGKSVEKAGKQAEDAGDGFTVAKGAIADFIGNGLSQLVSMGVNAIKTIAGLAAETREYRKTLATLDTAAKDAGVNTDKMREKFTDLMGVFNDDASVTEGLNNLMAAGFDEKNIDAITAQLEGAALKFKDTLKFEGVSDGLQETLATGKAIGPFAELLERSGVNLETFDEGLGKATTSAEKQNYVLQELSKLGLADVSKNFREQNADMIAAEKANVEYQNSMAALGEKVEPITTKIQQGFTKILDKVTELVGGADLEAFGEEIDEAFDGFINDVLPKIVDGLQWIIDNKDILIAGIAGIGAAMLTMNVANMIMNVVKAFKAFKAAQEGATVAQWLLNLAMNANPVGLVVAAIMGLVTAFVILWTKSETFRNFWIGLWDKIKSVAADAWKGLTNGAKKAWEGTKAVFSKVGSFFSETFSKAWQKVKDIFSTGGKIFDGIKDGIVNAFKKVVNAIIRGINKVVAVPFNALNKVLDKIRTVEIAGFSPFSNLISKISVPEIPELLRGGLLKKGQRGFLEGKGDEAVLPLQRDTAGIKRIATAFLESLGADVGRIKSGLSATAYRSRGAVSGATASGTAVGANHTVVNAGMTVNYNGRLSRKELKRLENDNYTAIRTRLRTEGAI